MKETLIFLKIQDVFQKYWDWNEQKINLIFFKIRAVFKKIIKAETVFTKTEMSKKQSINFLQNNPLGFILIPVSFPLVEAHLKPQFSQGLKLHSCI